MPTKRTIPRVCPSCGANFLARPDRIRIGRDVYCSRACIPQSPPPPAPPRQPIEPRFWAKVDKSGDCWIWTGGKLPQGYGCFGVVHGVTRRAHRVAWELAAGAIPPGLSVLHACDNPSCVRNDEEGQYEIDGILCPRRGHLWLGTQDQNLADMVRKGRWRGP